MSHYGALHQAARAYAASGIPVFPCKAGAKTPATENGFHDATTDLAQIDRWWSDNPDYNLAICPEHVGWAVVDIEAGGIGQWDELRTRNGYPEIATYSVVTPRGGRHLYFDGSLKSTTKKLAGEIHKGVGGIDTRGRGGYVLVPPSVVNGKAYTVETDTDPAPLPAWIPPIVEHEVEEKGAAFGAPVPPGHVLELLRSIDPACDRDTWRDVVAALANTNTDADTRAAAHAWSRGDFHGYVTPHNYDGEDAVDQVYDTMPPRADGVGYGTILHHARLGGYAGQSAVGIREPASEVFAHVLSSSPGEEPTPVPTNPFRFMDETEWPDTPEPAWAIDGIIPTDAVTVITAETGHYKTFVTLDMAMSLAAGVPFADRPLQPKKTYYAAGEGHRDVRMKRVPAWRMVKGLDPVRNFKLGRLPRISIPAEGENFIRGIRETLEDGEEVGMIVLDTYARSMGGLNENDAQDVGLFTVYADRLRHEFPGVAIVVLAHTGKDKSRGTRGSTALRANTDTYIEIESHRDKRIIDLHVVQHRDADDGFRLFFKGSPVLDSLYFSPITEQDARKALATEEELSGPKVGAALRSLQAVGIGKAVSTMVLAQHLAPQQPEQDHEAWQKQVSRVAKDLGRSSRTRLAGYCEKDGNVLLWFLPS